MWRTYFPIGAPRSSAGAGGTRPAIRRPARSSAAWAARRTSGAAADAARKAHCEIHADGGVVMRCGTQDIGTGTRTHHGDGRRPRRSGLPMRRGQGRDRRQQLPVQRRRRRQHDVARRSSPAIRVTAGQGARRAVRARGAGAWRRRPPRSSPATAAFRSKDDAVEGPRRGRTRAGCSAPSRSRWTASGKRASRPAARAACSSPRSRWTSRPASRGSSSIVCVQDCGLDRRSS